MNSSITESIKSLPPLSKTIENINKVYNRPDSSINDMAKAIENDPMIIANILKAANSPLYGFGKEINSISQAVSLFGMKVTRSIALANSVRKLLNIDMQPYGISSEKFAEISEYQSLFVRKWYEKIDREKADKLFLAAFLQEMGAIIIANTIIQNDEMMSFSSEIGHTNNIAQVEKSYADFTSSEVTAVMFKHWGFDTEFINMIKFADNPSHAPDEIKEYSIALNIVKNTIPINKPLSEISIKIGMEKAAANGYDLELFQSAVESIQNKMKGIDE